MGASPTCSAPFKFALVAQLVERRFCKADVIGSTPVGGTISISACSLWGHSSVGRAQALQAWGQGFESPCLHSGLYNTRCRIFNDMRHSFLRQLIRETLLIEAVAPKWIEDLIMSTEMADIASDVDPTTSRSGLDYFVEDNAKFIRSLEDEHGAGSAPIKNIGAGFQGTVWQLPDGNVMKLASDYGADKRGYKQYLTKMKMQHAGDTASVGDLRILDVFPITWRYPKDVGDPHVPEHAEVAVIMDKVVPLDKSKELEDSMNVILVSIMLTLSRLCVPYLKEEYQDDDEGSE